MAAPEKTPKKSSDSEPKKVFLVKSATDLQRMKLQRLMDHPERPVPIPEPHKERIMAAPPEFNRNVMGSSAGAGSGEFHVYRHIRRREYARQKHIGERARKEEKDVAFHTKIEENKRMAEERTAKKRAKRLKKKMKGNEKKATNVKASSKGTEDKKAQESELMEEDDDDENDDNEHSDD